ncbi:hypothetical protein HI846_06185 [Micrococcus luteus]|uniref:Mercury transporter n=2 Tax=Brachybacterium TaxID=43668 RepID=A0A3R8QPP1_9MICO|nr:hypothetical protein C0205_05125 [Micrococcus luteus]KAB1903565.1 hypothetical protein F8198_01595 [Micrococcus luteus NCTC 2665]PNL17543.1 hypothetical protein CEQ11_004890 [Micrococcus sp. FDAARGOS_333]RRR19237.1 hypothetical protein DS079_06250 [Brachybacterium paraconglomeratum]GLI29757.1 hypothetical protein BCONGLO52_05980 [Brachybacterium conglomeratum]
MSGDKDHDSHRAGVLVGAGTGLLLLACCALPLLICCGLPLLAAGGALAGIGGFLGNPWLIGAGIAVGVAVTAAIVLRRLRRHRRRSTGCCGNRSTTDRGQ